MDFSTVNIIIMLLWIVLGLSSKIDRLYHDV